MVEKADEVFVNNLRGAGARALSGAARIDGGDAKHRAQSR